MVSIHAIKLMQAAQEARHGVGLFNPAQCQGLARQLLKPRLQLIHVFLHRHAS